MFSPRPSSNFGLTGGTINNETFTAYYVHNPSSFINNPPVNTITELPNGSWWADSWRDADCDSQINEMLVPIIFYMDDISLNSHRRLTLTPLNMVLDIFSTKTQKSN